MVLAGIAVTTQKPNLNTQSVQASPKSCKVASGDVVFTMEWYGGTDCWLCFLEPCFCPYSAENMSTQLARVISDSGELKAGDIVVGALASNGEKVNAPKPEALLNQFSSSGSQWKVLRNSKPILVNPNNNVTLNLVTVGELIKANSVQQ